MTRWASLRRLNSLASPSRHTLSSSLKQQPAPRWISILSQKPKFNGAKSGGVFGLPGLQRADNWNAIANRCIFRCEKLAEEVRKWKNLEDPLLLQKFDELSNELCIVLDTAELCRNVHPDEEFCRAAEQAYLSVSTLIQNLNADYKLYEPLSQLRSRSGDDKTEERNANFSEEDTFMMNSLALDFERGGITLPKSEKQNLIKLQDDALRYGFEFMANAHKMQSVGVPAYLQSALPRRMRHVIEVVPGENQGIFRVNGESVGDVLRSIVSSKDREILYEATHEQISLDGLPVLDNLIESRRDMAAVLGEESFAEMQFNGRLASSYEEVNGFLRDLSKLVDKKVQQEMKVLSQYQTKKQEGGVLESWDLSYCLSQAKADKYNNSADEVAQYFPISAVLDGMAMVMKRTFGVTLYEDTSGGGGVEKWHSSVKKFALADEEHGMLGHIYLDLSPRGDKSAQAAHFCIRCGRNNGDGESYQTPVVALVCRFNRTGSTDEMLLSYTEYETLWHEFGHAVHSLLSRTTYQHLSGTRVATDLVEIPSHLFEYFASDPRVLSEVARHYRTGSPMPSRMLSELCGASRYDFAGVDVQHQALLAAFDLRLHGREPPIGDTLSAYNSLKQSNRSITSTESVAPFASFQHLVTYGAGYYSYLFARIISAQLYDVYLKEDPFAREAGDAIRYGLLVYGAAKPPGELLKGLLVGDKPDCTPFLNSLQAGLGGDDRDNRLTLPVRY